MQTKTEVLDVAMPDGYRQVLFGFDEKVLDASSLGIVVTDLERKVLYANDEAMKMLAVKSYQGLNLNDFIKDDASKNILDRQTSERRTGLIGNYTVELTREDGSQLGVEVTGLPVRDRAAKVVGSLAILSSLQQRRLVSEIHRLNRDVANPNELLSILAVQLKQILTFDMLIVSRYSEELQHVNSFFIFGHMGQDAVQKRWIPLGIEQARWIGTHETEQLDLSKVLEEETWAHMQKDPFVKGLFASGYRQILRRPVRRFGKVKASLTLMSKHASAFDDHSAQMLDELPVDAAVLRALELIDDQKPVQRLELVAALNRCTTVRSACKTLAERLTKLFGWAHVSIFRVDRGEEPGLAIMVEQHWIEREGSSIRLPLNYKQPIVLGLLGRVISSRALVNVGDVRQEPDYHPGVMSGKPLSELCCPVFFDSDGEKIVRFVINVEDERENAFSSDECSALAETAKEIGGVLQRISQVSFLTQCFDRASEPIFVTDRHLVVKKANAAAARLLGYKSSRDVAGPMPDLFQESDGPERLGGEVGDLGVFNIRRIEDAHDDEFTETPTVPVYVSKEAFLQDLEGFIFVARDLREAFRMIELQLFERAAYEVAVETSTPLMLAMGELENLEERLFGADKDSVKICMQRLERVSHSYSRLALFNSAARDLPPDFSLLDLSAELDAIISGLTPTERAMVNVYGLGEPTLIRGDHFQIAMVLETLLSLLIRVAPENQPVRVDLSHETSEASIRMVGRLPGSGGRSTEQARRASTWGAAFFMALPMLRKFVENHLGELTETQVDDRGEFVLRIPMVSAS